MKFGVLKSIGHNVARSLAGGIGLMVDLYEIDVFGDAQRSEGGLIEIDFLEGTVTKGSPSRYLQDAVQRYQSAFGALCESHGVAANVFVNLKGEFGVDKVYGRRFTVFVEDNLGRSSKDEYVGIDGISLRRAQNRFG